MKTKSISFLLMASIILFSNWIVMILIGSFASICGAGKNFYCGPFCYLALLVFLLSIGTSIILAKHKR